MSTQYEFTSQDYDFTATVSGVLTKAVVMCEYSTTAFNITGEHVDGTYTATAVEEVNRWNVDELIDYIIIDSADNEFVITANTRNTFEYALLPGPIDIVAGPAIIKEGDIKIEITVDDGDNQKTVLDTSVGTDLLNEETSLINDQDEEYAGFAITFTVPDQVVNMHYVPTATLQGSAPPGVEIDVTELVTHNIVGRGVANSKGNYSILVPTGVYDLRFYGKGISGEQWIYNKVAGHGDYSTKFGESMQTAMVQKNDAESLQQIGDIKWGQCLIFDSFDNTDKRHPSLPPNAAIVSDGRCGIGYGTYVDWIIVCFDPTLFNTVSAEESEIVEADPT